MKYFVLSFKKRNKYRTLDILAFLSVLLIGSDRIGFYIGVQVKLVQGIIFLLLVNLLIKNHWKFASLASPLIFVFFTLCSVVFSHYFDRALIYYSNIVFNVLISFTAFTIYVKYRGINTFIAIYRRTMHIQVALMILQMLCGYAGYNIFLFSQYIVWRGFIRVSLWFYEPSYLATYLIFWVMFSASMWLICGDESYKKETFISVAAEILTTSTTGYLALALCFSALYVTLLLMKRISPKSVLLIFPVMFVYYCFSLTDLYDVVIGRINRQGFEGASGGRMKMWSETIEVFKNNVLLGVGPGCYGRYLHTNYEHVPSNVTLELLATLGLFGMLSFYWVHADLMIKGIKKLKKKLIPEEKSNLIVSTLLGLIVFLVTLQANQNYLRLYHWMFLGVINGLLISASKSCDIEKFNLTNFTGGGAVYQFEKFKPPSTLHLLEIYGGANHTDLIKMMGQICLRNYL